MVFCRLDDTDGYLAVTVRRALFFTARKPRCLLEAERDEISGSVQAGRFGRSRIELIKAESIARMTFGVLAVENKVQLVGPGRQ